MAKKTDDIQKNEKPSFTLFGEDLKNNKLESPVLLYGRERFLVEWALGGIIKRFVAPQCRQLDLSVIPQENMTAENIILNCETFPMMSEKRVVVVRSHPALSSGKYSEDDEKALLTYIEKMSDSAMLVFVSDSVNETKKMVKRIKDVGSAYCFDALNESDLGKFIGQRLRAMGKEAYPGTVREIMRLSGYLNRESDYGLYNLENDLKKLAAYSNGKLISSDDVHKCVSGDVETDIFKLWDAISIGRRDRAMQMLLNMISEGEAAEAIFAYICSQFEMMVMVKEMRSEGRQTDYISTELKLNKYRIQKVLGFIEKYESRELKRILAAIYEYESKQRNGELDAETALELLLSQL